MKNFTIQIAALLFITGVVLYLTFQPNPWVVNPSLSLNQSSQNNISRVKINDTTIKVEVVDTADKRNKGLSGRDSLASDSGMLFIYDKMGKYPFWMKGMKFPLDFIWISGLRIVDILTNIAPPSPNQPDQSLPIYQSITPIDKVLEVAGGFASSHNIHVDDTIEIIK